MCSLKYHVEQNLKKKKRVEKINPLCNIINQSTYNIYLLTVNKETILLASF